VIGFTLHLTSLVLGSQRGAVWEWWSCPCLHELRDTFCGRCAGQSTTRGVFFYKGHALRGQCLSRAPTVVCSRPTSSQTSSPRPDTCRLPLAAKKAVVLPTR